MGDRVRFGTKCSASPGGQADRRPGEHLRGRWREEPHEPSAEAKCTGRQAAVDLRPMLPRIYPLVAGQRGYDGPPSSLSAAGRPCGRINPTEPSRRVRPRSIETYCPVIPNTAPSRLPVTPSSVEVTAARVVERFRVGRPTPGAAPTRRRCARSRRRSAARPHRGTPPPPR